MRILKAMFCCITGMLLVIIDSFVGIGCFFYDIGKDFIKTGRIRK